MGILRTNYISRALCCAYFLALLGGAAAQAGRCGSLSETGTTYLGYSWPQAGFSNWLESESWCINLNEHLAYFTSKAQWDAGVLCGYKILSTSGNVRLYNNLWVGYHSGLYFQNQNHTNPVWLTMNGGPAENLGTDVKWFAEQPKYDGFENKRMCLSMQFPPNLDKNGAGLVVEECTRQKKGYICQKCNAAYYL